MLKLYRWPTDEWRKLGADLPPEIVWIDLLSPSDEEKAFVERRLNIRVPSEESLSEIEASSRMIFDHEKLYLSSPSVRIDEDGEADLTSIGFVIGPHVLVTVRFGRCRSSTRSPSGSARTTICRTACASSPPGRGHGRSRRRRARASRRHHRQLSRDRLQGRPRPQQATGPVEPQNARGAGQCRRPGRSPRQGARRPAQCRPHRLVRARGRQRLDHAGVEAAARRGIEGRGLAERLRVTLWNNYELLLDAILGFVNIQQNDLFKILTIVSVAGVPPTILVGIWGMNFKHIPEFDWTFGYPLAWLAVMPSFLIALALRRSLATFFSNLSAQNETRDFGIVALEQDAWRCQKQPWTKTTHFRLGTTISGVPGRDLL